METLAAPGFVRGGDFEQWAEICAFPHRPHAAHTHTAHLRVEGACKPFDADVLLNRVNGVFVRQLRLVS